MAAHPVQLVMESMVVQPTLVPRCRSAKAAHLRRHATEFGSTAVAAKKCHRCKFYHLQKAWEAKCVYADANGSVLTWIIEQPDPFKPWGLGCCLCLEYSAHCRDLSNQAAPENLQISLWVPRTLTLIGGWLRSHPIQQHRSKSLYVNGPWQGNRHMHRYDCAKWP